jgi:hypothetical protein
MFAASCHAPDRLCENSSEKGWFSFRVHTTAKGFLNEEVDAEEPGTSAKPKLAEACKRY